MNWEDQGRQQHGWFGDGKGPTTDTATSASDADSPSKRMDAVIYCSSVALHRALLGSVAERLIVEERARLNALLITWSHGGDMDRAEFAGKFFGRAASDPVTMALRTAALTAKLSGHPDALRDAGEHLASTMQTVGLGRWRWFLEDAQARANEPSTVAALEKSQKRTDPHNDAIRPVDHPKPPLGVPSGAASSALKRDDMPGDKLVKPTKRGDPAAATVATDAMVKVAANDLGSAARRHREASVRKQLRKMERPVTIGRRTSRSATLSAFWD